MECKSQFRFGFAVEMRTDLGMAVGNGWEFFLEKLGQVSDVGSWGVVLHSSLCPTLSFGKKTNLDRPAICIRR